MLSENGDPHRLRPVLRLRRHADDHQGAHHRRKNDGLLRPAINKDAEIHLFGQEVNPETWAVSKADSKDGQVGLVDYEINFNRYFYRYTPPRPLEEIEGEIRVIEHDILRMLAEVTGGRA